MILNILIKRGCDQNKGDGFTISQLKKQVIHWRGNGRTENMKWKPNTWHTGKKQCKFQQKWNRSPGSSYVNQPNVPVHGAHEGCLPSWECLPRAWCRLCKWTDVGKASSWSEIVDVWDPGHTGQGAGQPRRGRWLERECHRWAAIPTLRERNKKDLKPIW